MVRRNGSGLLLNVRHPIHKVWPILPLDFFIFLVNLPNSLPNLDPTWINMLQRLFVVFYRVGPRNGVCQSNSVCSV